MQVDLLLAQIVVVSSILVESLHSLNIVAIDNDLEIEDIAPALLIEPKFAKP